LQECFAGAERGELVRGHGSGAVAIDETGTRERYGRTSEERAPALLILDRALSEGQSHGGVLGDLLGQAGIDASQVSQALGGQHAHHAGLSCASEQRDDVPALASQS
jgi:hypothetical protein